MKIKVDKKEYEDLLKRVETLEKGRERLGEAYAGGRRLATTYGRLL